MIFSAFLIILIGFTNAAEKIVTHLPPEKLVVLLPAVMQCLTETGLDPEVLIQLRNGKFGNDKKFNNFLYCAGTKTGYGDKNGRANVDKAVELFPKKYEKDVRKVLDECNKETGNDAPEKVGKIFKCFVDKTPVIALL